MSIILIQSSKLFWSIILQNEYFYFLYTVFWCQYFCGFACVSFLMQHLTWNRGVVQKSTFVLLLLL